MSFNYTELDLNRFDKEVVRYLQSLTGRVHHAAMNALRHLERAKAIAGIDPEMAAFRAITAEEEAATAFFSSLKQLRHKNSKKLNYRDHKLKAGLSPFITVVHHQIHEIFPLLLEGRLKWENLSSNKEVRRLRLIIKINGVRGWIMPEPPLNFRLSDSDSNEPTYFESQINKLSQGVGKEKALDHIKEIANLRNKLLYASDTGYLRLNKERILEDIEACNQRVFRILRILCLVHPYKEHALFVQQCMDSYLLMMERITKEELNNEI
ncbi:MAG: hypothetical protein ACFB0C_11560 [Leptolyngbyaceae cyanobacterium]